MLYGRSAVIMEHWDCLLIFLESSNTPSCFSPRCIFVYAHVTFDIALSSVNSSVINYFIFQEWLNLKRAQEQKHLTANCLRSLIPVILKTP